MYALTSTQLNEKQRWGQERNEEKGAHVVEVMVEVQGRFQRSADESSRDATRCGWLRVQPSFLLSSHLPHHLLATAPFAISLPLRSLWLSENLKSIRRPLLAKPTHISIPEHQGPRCVAKRPVQRDLELIAPTSYFSQIHSSLSRELLSYSVSETASVPLH